MVNLGARRLLDLVTDRTRTAVGAGFRLGRCLLTRVSTVVLKHGVDQARRGQQATLGS
jgi:hypothetical protein